jgi:hypothetical protein
MKKLTNNNFNEIEIGEIYIFNVSDKNKNSHRRVIDLDANIICIITDIDVVEKRIYFNIILSDNNIYWYTGPDEANIANWNIEFEKIETNKQN